MRSIWSGTIGFGTIQIPVRMYGALEDLKVSMNQVHAEDKGRVRYEKVCEVCQKELLPEEIIKAYPVGDSTARKHGLSDRLLSLCSQRCSPL